MITFFALTRILNQKTNTVILGEFYSRLQIKKAQNVPTHQK